jgi:hypothetical protein
MHQPNSTGSPFPTRLAFMAQFGTETAVECERCLGRVEHIVSGAVAHYHTLDELWAFIRRGLAIQASAPEALP